MNKISNHFTKIENKEITALRQIKNIDFIYFINLDQRKDRLHRCLQQFAPHQIVPHRVAGINGWALSQEVFNEVALIAEPSMQYDRTVQVSFVPGNSPGVPFDASIYGKPCLHKDAPGGGMGGCLTHLSILQDAYDSGYETAWVLEDDFTIKGNPHELNIYIERLDELVGKEGWDILYTDDDSYYTLPNLRHHCGSDYWLRPGLRMTTALIERTPIGDDFFKIGGRTQAHSYLIRRSGMQKILEFVKANGLFFPFDTELPCIPGFTMYNLKYDLVHGRDRRYSDTYYPHFTSEQYGHKTL